MKTILIEKNFSKTAVELRREFDKNFTNPHLAHSQRFVWDYWHVPDQYTLLRTPAYNYFRHQTYMKFHKEIVLWGRRELGCWDISPPWMSNYVEGCKQELHSDVPHGPWAFVFSLTPEHKKFTGGETWLLRPSVLNYWSHFRQQKNRELSSFVKKIPSRFNQLIVFDPRIPHGVTEVRGTHNPAEGRLVIHGWFTEPKVYIEGPLPSRSTEQKLNQAFEKVAALIHQQIPHSHGVLSLQLRVHSSGRVKSLRWATQNLLLEDGSKPLTSLKQIEKIYSQIEFSSARQSSLITVPLIVG